MGIIEIILTIIAWEKGWKWSSLIPMFGAFIIGIIFGLAGIAINYLIFVDISAVIALVIMSFKSPDDMFKNKTKKES